MVTNATDNATYHLGELERTRIVTPVVRMQINTFKKWHDVEPDRALETEGDVSGDEDE